MKDNALLYLALGGFGLFAAKKLSRKPCRVLDENCEAVIYHPKTEQAAQRIVDKFAAAGIKAANRIGGYEALGPPPSNLETVKAFATAWSTQWLRIMAPGCMKKLDLFTAGDDQGNPFGPDINKLIDPTNMPPAFVEAAQRAFAAIQTELTNKGYDTGVSLAVGSEVSKATLLAGPHVELGSTGTPQRRRSSFRGRRR